MNMEEDIDQFQLLEEKIDNLIELMSTLKMEKESLTERLRIQEERITGLTEQVESLSSARDRARQRIVSLLEKIDRVQT
ncbi:MAG: cell division protein ZapB [Pseudomonadota bacterium]